MKHLIYAVSLSVFAASGQAGVATAPVPENRVALAGQGGDRVRAAQQARAAEAAETHLMIEDYLFLHGHAVRSDPRVVLLPWPDARNPAH